MVSTSDMILSSLSKVWHLVPIVITIILFKKFINNRDKKRSINKNEENVKNGLSLELRARKKYEDLGYKIIDKGIKDQGIDLICSKEGKTLLLQCKSYSKANSITDEDIILFHSNAIKYVKTNNLVEEDVGFRYVILYSDILDKPAVEILQDDSYNCKYVILSN